MLFNKSALFYACFNTRLFFYLLFSHFDVVTANDLDTLPACFVASKLKHKRLIFDSHELFTEMPELLYRPFSRKVWRFFECRLLPRVKYCMTVSESIAQEYKKRYGVEMQVVRNFPKLAVQNRIEKKQNTSAKQIILYQGALNIGRGLEYAIAAMKYVTNAELWLVGDGDIRNKLEELVRLEGMGGRVLFFGKVPATALMQYTVQAHVGLSLEEDLGLNYRYSLPNKIFDYIQAGVPVLSSRLPERENLFAVYNIGLLASNFEPQYLAGLITEIINNQADWKQPLLEAAKELCWEKEEAKALNLYFN